MANNDSRAKKISELTVANTTSNSDLLYIVQNTSGNAISMSINVGTIAPQQQYTVGPIEGSINVVSNGQNNVAWFSFNSNTYIGVKILVDAYNPTENARSFGDIFIVSSGSASATNTCLATIAGSNGFINLVANIIANGYVFTLYLSVANATSASNIQIGYQVLYFNY